MHIRRVLQRKIGGQEDSRRTADAEAYGAHAQPRVQLGSFFFVFIHLSSSRSQRALQARNLSSTERSCRSTSAEATFHRGRMEMKGPLQA